MRKTRFNRIVRMIALAVIVCGWIAQSAIAQEASDITGMWQGMLQTGDGQRVVLKVSKAGAGAGWTGELHFIDSGDASAIPSITLTSAVVRFTIPSTGARFQGKLDSDGASMAGMWMQGSGSYALNLVRANGDAAWAVPEPTRPMARDANPEFEVATIKQTKPNDNVDGYDAQGRHVTVENQTVIEMIEYAYGVHRIQVKGGPSWLEEQDYDIDGISDMAGKPDDRQIRLMVQKLLVDRFQLTTHLEKKELTVDAIKVGKGGAKLTKSLGDPDGLADERGNGGRNGLEVQYINYRMQDLAQNLQNRAHPKPVIDQTGIAGRYDFTLKWWPDGWQNPGPDAAPALSTALQEQLGLKLESVNMMVDVIVIDKVERPSAN